MVDNVPGVLRRCYAIVGAGKVGNAIGRALIESGFTVEAVVSRSHVDALELADTVGASTASTHVSSLPKKPCNIICAVRDDDLARLASELATADREWQDSLLMHTSGARGSTVFESLRSAGAVVGTFHPLASIPDGSAPGIFSDIIVAVEGDREALECMSALAAALGARPVVISGTARPAYHLGASIASNFVVSLFGMIDEIISAAGFSDLSAGELYAVLTDGTLENIKKMGSAKALTGPVARGDTHTIGIHLQFLRDHLPHLIPLYSSLATETVRLAVKAGKLESSRAREVLDSIHEALLPSIDSDKSF